MLKKALKQAFFIALGTTLGGTVTPRLLHPDMYTEWSPMWSHVLCSFAVGYVISAAILLIVDWFKTKCKEEEKET